jgi:hypothetical protein
MTLETVQKLIQDEVAGNWSQINDHGCDLRKCMVQPELREYDDRGSGHLIKMWLVFEEYPEDRSGYKIVYGEKVGMFGLAGPGTQRDVFIGYYGTFLETYHAM